MLIKDYYRPVPQPSTHIDPIPAFEEYKFNPRFQELIDSGLFCHINGYYVINDEQYIEQQPDGTFGLTEYAAEHIDECALTFRYITRTSIPNYEFRSGVFYRDGAGKSVPQYSEEDNLEIVERAKRLKEAQRRFAAMEADHPTPQTFWQAANQYMASRHWNKPVFEEKTGLGDNLYRDGHNHPEKDVSFQTAISVCAGLAVDLETSLRLLELAGYGQVGKVRSVRIGSKHYPCIFVEVSEHDAHQYMQLEWADVKAEERSERCLIEDGHGGYIMCPESNKCINCPKVGSFNFDTNRPTSLDALYTESEFEPASQQPDQVDETSDILAMLVEELGRIKPKYAEIFKELYKGNERPLTIARAVGIGKTQAYTDVPRVRELAEKLYRDMMA